MKDLHSKTLILLNLFEGNNDYITTTSVADVLGVSSRSVIRYLRLINALDDSESFKIIAIPNKGLKLQVFNQSNFEIFKESILKLENYQEEYFELLIQILFESKVYFSELADKLNYSESALYRLIHILNKRLEVRGLRIIRENNKLFFSGNEIKIRNLMHQLSTEKSIDDLDLSSNLKSIYVNLSTKLPCKEEDDYCQDFTMFMFITLIRCINHHYVLFNPIMHFLVTDKVGGSRELSLVKEVFEIHFNQVIPIDEELYLRLYFMNQGHDNANFNEIFESLLPIVKKSLETIDHNHKTTFGSDEQLKFGLIYHITSSFAKYLLLSKSNNKLIDQIRLNYTNAYIYAQELVSILNKEIDIEINENELGYVAIHFEISLEKSNGKAKNSAYILYNLNQNTAELLKARIENRFSDISIMSVLNVNESVLPDDGLFLSCDDSLDFKYNAIYVSPFISESDTQNIYHALLDSSGFAPLIKLCHNENFYYVSQNLDKKGILDFLTNDLHRKGYLSSEESMNLIERERLSSTEIALNIAFPHCHVTGKSFLSATVLKQPIIWKNNVVQLILLMGLNKDDLKVKDAIKYLFQNIQDIEKVNNLIKSRNFDDFISVLRRR